MATSVLDLLDLDCIMENQTTATYSFNSFFYHFILTQNAMRR